MKYLKTITLFTISSLLLTSCLEMRTVEQLFNDSLNDVKVINEKDIRTLVNLTKDDENIYWNEEGDKVLFFAFHNSLSKFSNGTFANDTYLYSLKEFRDWYMPKKMNTMDKTLRLKQLLGLKYSSAFDKISTFYISPSNVIRPAYIKDPTKEMKTSFPEGEEESYIEWFNNELAISRNEKTAFPWTRLGYSFDWSYNEGDRYGLSQFLSFKDKEYTFVNSYSVNEFYSYVTTL